MSPRSPLLTPTDTPLPHTTRFLSGQRRQRAAPVQLRCAVTYGVFIERRNAQVPVDGPEMPQPDGVQTEFMSVLFFRLLPARHPFCTPFRLLAAAPDRKSTRLNSKH